MLRRVWAVLVALLGAALLLPSAAFAASSTAATTAAPASTAVTPSLGGQGTNPLSPGFPQPSVSIPAPTTAVPTVTPTTSAGSGSGLTGNSAIIIAIGALIVLGGISFYIWRDARRRAPVRAHHGAGPIDEGRRAGSKARPKPRKLSPAERKRRKRGRAR